MPLCLGLDIAKSKIDAALLMDNGKLKTKVFGNTPKGFVELRAWLAAHGAAKVSACMEASGSYHEAVATSLFDCGHTVSVANPARVKSFGACEGIRTKNDQIDARLIARFGMKMEPTPWQPLPLEIRQLRALGRRRDDLLAMRVQECNRAGDDTEAVEESIESMLALIDHELKESERKIGEHIADHDGLKQRFDLLQSIPGVGPVCAEALLSETGGFVRFARAAEMVAFAGLSPQERSSGTSVRGTAHISKRGNSRLRRLLYMPAMAASWCNPLVAALAERLKAKGKPRKVVICACMKKLLQIAFGVLKHNQPFDPNYKNLPANA